MTVRVRGKDGGPVLLASFAALLLACSSGGAKNGAGDATPPDAGRSSHDAAHDASDGSREGDAGTDSGEVQVVCASTVWVDRGDGGDSGAGTGTETAPYRTITAGIASVGDGGCVEVRAGTYPEDLNITKSNFSLLSAPGDEVIVSGFAPVLGWAVDSTNASGTVYKTTSTTRPTALYVALTPQTIAHGPQHGWFKVTAVTTGTGDAGATTTISDPTDLIGQPALAGASAEVFVGTTNSTAAYPILSNDAVAGTITMGTIAQLAVGDRFILTNAVPLLAPGEWAVTGTGPYTVYFEPSTASDLAATQTPAPARNAAMLVSGSHVIVKGLVVAGSDNQGIEIGGSDNTVEDCVVVQNHATGIFFRNGANLTAVHNVSMQNGTGIAAEAITTATISENEIAFNQGDGADLTGVATPASNYVFARNYVHHQLQEVVHPDGLQCWGNIQNLLIDRNVDMFNGQLVYTENDDPTGDNITGVRVTGNILADNAADEVLPGGKTGAPYLFEGNTVLLPGLGIFNRFIGADFTLQDNVYGAEVAVSNEYIDAWNSDYNLFYVLSGNVGAIDITPDAGTAFPGVTAGYHNYATLAAFAAATGGDTHSAQVNGSSQLVTNMPNASTTTQDPTLQTLTTLTVLSTSAFHVGDVIEVDMDGVERHVTAVDSATITFDPPLPMKLFSGANVVDDWGPSPKSLTRDATLPAGSPGLTLSKSGGRVGSSVSIASYQAGDPEGTGRRVLPVVPADVKAGIPGPTTMTTYLF